MEKTDHQDVLKQETRQEKVDRIRREIIEKKYTCTSEEIADFIMDSLIKYESRR